MSVITPEGSYKEITSLSNPTIKHVRSLSQRKNRSASRQFLAEGLKLVADAVDANWPLNYFIFAKRMADNERVQRIAARTKARGGTVLVVNDLILKKVLRRDNPQMVLGVFEQRFSSTNQIKPEGRDLWVTLEAVKDPGNLGTIIRTADAAGAKGVLLVGNTTDPFGLEAIRATMGSVFYVPLIKLNHHDFLNIAKDWSAMIIGTHMNAKIDYRTPDYTQPCLLLMGNEQNGLSSELAQACKQLVKIPQCGRADSLNLAIATGLMLYEIQRAHMRLP